MATITIPNSFTADTLIVADEINENFNTLANLLNGNLDEDNIDSIGSGNHGDLSAVSDTFHAAESISISDSGGYFTGSDVETVLQEVGSSTNSFDSSGITYVGQSYHASTASSCSVTMSAGTATTGVIVTMGAYMQSNAGSIRYDLAVNGNDLSNNEFSLIYSTDDNSTSRCTVCVEFYIAESDISGFSLDFDDELTFSFGTRTASGTIATESDFRMIVKAV